MLLTSPPPPYAPINITFLAQCIFSLIQVVWKLLYKTSSASDHGTLYQIRNLIQRRNVGKKPKKDFNAHDSFFNLVTTSHILAAAIEILGMDNLDDTPCELLVPKDIHTLPKPDRRAIFDHICHVIVHSYVDLHHSVEVRVQESVIDSSKSEDSCIESEKDTRQDEEEDEEDEADESDGEEDEDKDDSEEDEDEEGEGECPATSANSNKGDCSQEDNIQAYAKEVMTLGLLYAEFSDGIREGDGIRVTRCWKFLMLIFKAAQRKNYSCEAFALLAQMNFILSPRLSQQLKWSRFINTRGGKGHNIPCDLHMEHLNRVLKDGIKGLGANKTEKAITRLGKCISSFDQILSNFDESLKVHHSADFHTVASLEKDITLVVNELTKRVQPFSFSKGRSHKSVRVKKTIMKTIDSAKFHLWMKEKWNSLLAGVL